MTDFVGASDAFTVLRKWYEEGRIILGYEYGNGVDYLGKLVGIDPQLSLDDKIRAIKKLSPDLFKLLVGPHGWAILQMLIARKGVEMNLPDFKSHQERDDYFRDHADYFSIIRLGGIGVSERIETKSLAEAERLVKAKQAVSGGRFLIYAVIDQQSALAKTVKEV